MNEDGTFRFKNAEEDFKEAQRALKIAKGLIVNGSQDVLILDEIIAAVNYHLIPEKDLGVVPLLTATGAGAEGRKVMGMAVFAGMLVATFLGVLLIPMLYVVVMKVTGGKRAPAPGGTPPTTLATVHGGGH